MRLLFILAVMFVGAIISMAKNTAGKMTNNEKLKNTTLTDESKKIMDKTARGINWMEKQWEESKKKAQEDNKDKYT